MKREVLSRNTEGLSRRQLGWYMLLRIIVISLFLAGAILYQTRNVSPRIYSSLPILFALVGFAYLQSFLASWFLTRVRRLKVFVQLQIIFDLVFTFVLIYVTGGIESNFSFIFILIIVGGGFFLSRRDMIILSSAAAILYGSLLDLQYYDYLPMAKEFGFPSTIDVRDVFFAVFVHVVAFFLVAILSGTLAERLRRSQAALAEKEIDYGELERLNRTILANISSGLMVIDSRGAICSFNASAERITGFPLQNIYGSGVSNVFPHIPFYNGEFIEVRRGEGRFVDKEGEEHILGYNSSCLKNVEGETEGLLVSFQDLTHVKELEEQLKRADRLSAVGQLAAGMAHEIRNPLASITGSVQLLMEGENLKEEDFRLMGIVVKEAERLSALLTDFLSYARPRPVDLVPSDLSVLLDELAEMASGDARFSSVKICRDYAVGCTLKIDHDQMRQALWNLLINAAEAMGGEGILKLGIDLEAADVYVEDSGSGIPENVRVRMFDPFFTTKEKGSGLGLATVHAIVEAHGGHILVDSAPGKGSRFTICLPKT